MQPSPEDDALHEWKAAGPGHNDQLTKLVHIWPPRTRVGEVPEVRSPGVEPTHGLAHGRGCHPELLSGWVDKYVPAKALITASGERLLSKR